MPLNDLAPKRTPWETEPGYTYFVSFMRRSHGMRPYQGNIHAEGLFTSAFKDLNALSHHEEE